mmetsp:Transcript_27043/g.38523  ORF Transcript_27043/g.38523 Transcript_27043/m.38523 type:complete len:147 (-) Transcript_27043:203-643(-)
MLLSKGYGFMEFKSSSDAAEAMKLIDGSVLDSDKRLTTVSSKTAGTASSSRGNNCKLIVRNVAFQASKQELAALFSAFDSLKRVRLPKQIGGEHRGFAFVEFNSSQEAQVAKESLKSLHLYGRHLVVEWAKEEDEQAELGAVEGLC